MTKAKTVEAVRERYFTNKEYSLERSRNKIN